jgi:hypothetical protein
MRHALAGAFLFLAATGAPAFAAPDDLPAYPPVVPPIEVTPPAADAPPAQYAAPAPSADAVPDPAAAPPVACENCAPPRIYDSHEVIKKIREVDHSRVINTTTVVPVYRHAPEPQQPERRLVRVPSVTVVHFVTHQYKVIEGPVTTYAEVPVVRRRAKDCHGRYGSCRRVLRVGG